MKEDNCIDCPFYAHPNCEEPRGYDIVSELSECPLIAFPMHKILKTDCGEVYKLPDGRGKTSEYYRRPTGEWIFKSGNLILGDSILNQLWDETQKRGKR